MTRRRLPSRARNRAPLLAKHADDWLMTYADMITLLLCFFVVFATLANAHQKKALQAAPPLVVQESQQNKTEGKEERTPLLPPPDLAPPQQEDVPPQRETPAPVPTPVPTLARETPPADSALTQPDPPLSLEQPPAAAQEEKQGDRILSFELASAATFNAGQATLNTEGLAAVKEVAGKLKDAAYRDYQITVEGHTDDTPVATSAFPSNWELSTARAAAVVRALVAEGLEAGHLRIAGYADTYPKLPNRTPDGTPIPENQAQNRRVVVRLEKMM